MLSVFVFAAKRMVKGAATLTSFALTAIWGRVKSKGKGEREGRFFHVMFFLLLSPPPDVYGLKSIEKRANSSQK